MALGCNPILMCPRLQLYGPEAATLCVPGMAACNTRIVRRSRHLLKDVPSHFAYYEVMRCGGGLRLRVRLRLGRPPVTYVYVYVYVYVHTQLAIYLSNPKP